MGKINILTKDIYNRIAAGEVVDRPYSALKELVENSLDAGATEISIYIEKGGKQLIKVCDNGSGIEPDDMRSAFIPHATSKVSCVEDLDKITTLGFRGEALASISSISRTEIVSVTEDNPAYKVVCEGGYTGKLQPAALDKGTEVSVHDLFYNTPARSKFLKSDKAEEGDIQNFVTRFILGNPQVSFRYYADGKLKLQSFGNGLDEAVAQVYGAKVISQCYKLSAEKNDIKISGFIGNQNFFKPNKSCQSLFLNGRYIVNNIISSAITNAYASYLMKRQYPFYVLFVDVPMDMVDVNVHPNKADVRFADGRAVYSAVYSVVSGVLDGTAKAADFVVDYARMPEIKSSVPAKQATISEIISDPRPSTGGATFHSREDFAHGGATEGLPAKQESATSDVTATPVGGDLPASDKLYTEEKPARQSPYADYEAPVIEDRENSYPLYAYFPDIQKKNVMVVSEDIYDQSEDSDFPLGVPERPAPVKDFTCRNYTYKGNLFNTYLMYEKEGDVYIIDQHAAHERLIYNKLKAQMADRNVPRQGMLIPYILSLTPEENTFMEENLMLVREMGFDIEPFGFNSYRICEVPVDLKDMDLKGFFDEVFSDLSGLKSLKIEDVLKDKLAMAACKHAVKGGMELTKQEADGLLADMNYDMGLKCPHGRPVAVKLTKHQIEKMFKRIV